MHRFELNPIAAVIVCSFLVMGFIGVFIAAPIAIIEWSWNTFIPEFSKLPAINPLQAGLLYIAGAFGLYLSGLIQIDFEKHSLD